ncbi:MAG: peptidoglycan DD-metalloendopeptidase family protein [Desulfopila sp.]|jgi:murein DD-endopeptidase MepM/ murein hydrolase activator NlpD|nr:peptidoglycan DD-metalloendopeptidase family protein [Desulfopila sp.]
MSEEYHIIIAGDQHSPRSYKFSRKNILITATLFCISICALLSTAFFTTGFYAYNKILVKRMASIKNDITSTQNANNDLQEKLDRIIAQNKEEIEALQTKHSLIVSRIELESSMKIAALEKKNLEQEMSFKEERALLLTTAVSELSQRSEFIENIISTIGIEVKTKTAESPKNSGGPFIAAENGVYDDLIFRADQYLKTIQTLPLGKPANGSVSSWYGKRKDPINGKNAFHSGVDFRGNIGDNVIATGDGKVIFAGKNGGFGKMVKIDHGNGYVSVYAHLHNYHVKKGDVINRGQTIGLIGNSGRTTGSHLHYEINHKGKPVNPAKFMKVADLTCNLTAPPEK